jgi:hypothetical protein
MRESVDNKVGAPSSEAIDEMAMKLAMFKTGDETHVTIECNLAVVMPAFGTMDQKFFYGLIKQVANAGSKGRYPDATTIEFMLAAIKGGKPRDEVEAMLLAQFAACLVASMRFANRLAHAESPQEQDSAERVFNKLARTTAALVGAFQHYRAGNEQKATGRSVNDGGRTIGENVNPPVQETASEKRVRLISVRNNPPRPPMNVPSEPEPVTPPRTRR